MMSTMTTSRMTTFVPQPSALRVRNSARSSVRSFVVRAENKNIRDEVQGAPGVSVPDNNQTDSYERIEAPVRGSAPDGGPPVAQRREGRDDMMIQTDGAAEKKVLGTEVAFPDIMRFNGAGPEVINSRLAMIGCVTAIAAELATHTTVAQQVSSAPILVAGVGILFTVASLITMVKGVPRKGNGVFSSDAEILNGRVAMIGFAGILLTEVITKTSAL